MPAVDPTRLSFQIADLLTSFDVPDEFHRKIRDLFSLYANRTLRYGDRSGQQPLMPTYRLPDPVMRQLHLELAPVLAEKPEAGLNLADELWQDETYEIKLTAIYILGHAALDQPEPILSRLNNWLASDLDPKLEEAIFHSGTHTLQSRFPDQWEAWIKSLLSQDSLHLVSSGLIGLRASVELSLYQKLPVIFRLISPILREINPAIVNELKRLIKVLAEQSPTETGYFLKQALSLSNSSGTARLIRQCIPMFPEEIQQDLQSALKAQ